MTESAGVLFVAWRITGFIDSVSRQAPPHDRSKKEGQNGDATYPFGIGVYRVNTLHGVARRHPAPMPRDTTQATIPQSAAFLMFSATGLAL